MDFLDVLLWVVIVFCGSMFVQFNIWWAIDSYFTRKEKHTQNILNALAETIKKMEENKEKENA